MYLDFNYEMMKACIDVDTKNHKISEEQNKWITELNCFNQILFIFAVSQIDIPPIIFENKKIKLCTQKYINESSIYQHSIYEKQNIILTTVTIDDNFIKLIIKYAFDECEYMDLGILGLSNFVRKNKIQSTFNKVQDKITSLNNIYKLEKIAGSERIIINWRQTAFENIIKKYKQNDYHKIVIKPNIILMTYRYVNEILNNATYEQVEDYYKVLKSYKAQCKIKLKLIVIQLNKQLPRVITNIIRIYF